MRTKFHLKLAKTGPFPAPGSPQETQGEYGKLTAAYTLLTGRALGVGGARRGADLQPSVLQPQQPSAPLGASWAELQAALEGVGWCTDKAPLLLDGSGHGRKFLTERYHGGLHLASASAATRRRGGPTTETIQRAFLLQLAEAICRGAPLVVDLRPCEGVDAPCETPATLLVTWRGMLETVRKRVLVAVRGHGQTSSEDSPAAPAPAPSTGGVRDILSGMAQSGAAGDSSFLVGLMARRPMKTVSLPESPYVCFSTRERPKVERASSQVVGGAPSASAIADELKSRWDSLAEKKKGQFHDEAARNKATNFSTVKLYDVKFTAWVS